MDTQSQRISELAVGAGCELDCPVCACNASGGADAGALARALAGGGARLNLVGGTRDLAQVLDLAHRGRDAGFAEIVVRTSALAFAEPGAAVTLFREGVDGVRVPLYSARAQVHDRIAGREGALVQALVGMRALAAAGCFVEIETPLLPERLQDLTAVVDLAARAVPDLRAARFHLPQGPVPAALAPPAFGVAGPALARALARCEALGVEAPLTPAEAIPFCALAAHPEHLRAFRFDPRRRARSQPWASHPALCEGCAARPQCQGLPASYLTAHGTAGVTPFARRPRDLYDQRTTPRRVWTDDQREAASRASLLVLRPTVNCNQDCVFCSANETSGNVWSDPDRMYRVIARAARRNLRQVSFSGGEPTLSKHLPSFIRVARRAGIPRVEVVTNGVLLDTPERVARLVDAGLTHAFVSLHAHDENLARGLTQKVGDFERTVRAIGLLSEAGVKTAVNHVITTRNYRYLPHFVAFARARFGGRVGISFAFVTPQYKALEHLDLLPRFSDVMPYLKRALLRALDLGQPAWVGSRQGIPPCQLGAFQAWSDVLGLAEEAVSEDGPQKTHGPACEGCRYARVCTGVWRPYAARYGTDELRTVPGTPVESLDAEALASMRQNVFGIPEDFDHVLDTLRDRADEAATRALADAAEAEPEPPAPPALDWSRPLRVALVGTGPRARRLARELTRVPGVSLDAVASPHAPDGDLGEFGHCPAYRDAAEALDDIRPEAVVIAAATRAHRALAEDALNRGIPVLLEKPLAGRLDDAEALVALAGDTGVPLVPAHNLLHAPGLAEHLAGGPHARIDYHLRCPADCPDAPRAWSHAGLYETLYHVLVVVGRGAGGGVPEVRAASATGTTRPSRVRATLAYADTEAEVRLDFDAAVEDLAVAVSGADGEARTWRRARGTATLEAGGVVTPLEPRAGELEAMVAAFRDHVLGQGPAAASASEAVDVMAACDRVIAALEAAGAPLRRARAPKHVASRTLG